MRRPLSLRAHLVIGAGCLMVGLFGGSVILWHITLGHREPPVLLFAIFSHAHLLAIVCGACVGLGVAQVQRDTVANRVLRREVEIAASIQHSLLPSFIPRLPGQA